MNKYYKIFFENEKKPDFKISYNKIKFVIKIYKSFYKKYGIKAFSQVFDLSVEDEIKWNILILSQFPNDIQELIKKEIIPNLNTNSLITIFIQTLSNALTNNDEEWINIYMDSFKKTDLIKDIKLKKDTFIMTLMDGKNINFTKSLDNNEQIKQASCECHNICHYYFNKMYPEDDKTYCVTILEKDVFNKNRYHSFLLCNGLVIDFARNTVIRFENYKKLFDFKIIMCVNGQQMLKNINRLNENNPEFKNNRISKVLKYAIYKHMKKDKRY